MDLPSFLHTDQTFGRQSKDARDEAKQANLQGARAALESFYYAFNYRSLEVFDDVWAPGDLVSLANPLGGILRGRAAIRDLYRTVFHGPARVWVELADIVECATPQMVVFSGRERGEFTRDGVCLPLAIRTSRVFSYFGPELGWRQVHHHGSIDDPEALQLYQAAVRGSTQS